MDSTGKEWFANWFDSEFYHILYKHRDDKEAGLFLGNLIDKLNIKQGSKILDMACGKGRHSIFLNEKGFDVTGIDLSIASIKHANKFSNDHLSFYVHDIRRPVRINFFDYVFNLFTSFGYFRTDLENLTVIKSAYNSLKPEGILVIDYLNVLKAINHLKPTEIKNIEDTEFTISKALIDGAIVKDISFEHKGVKHNYHEYVKAYELPQFEKFFANAGFVIQEVYGDYHLNRYSPESDRLIMVVKKGVKQ